MSHLGNKNKSMNDQWFTTIDTWRMITPYIPHKYKVWESFFGNGKSAEVLRKLGVNVYSKDLDFFEMLESTEVKQVDMVVSNIPFSKKYRILKALKKLGKPFILILPMSCISTLKLRSIFGTEMKNISLLIPKGRLKFEDKLGILNRKPTFSSLFLCWKIPNAERVVWL